MTTYISAGYGFDVGANFDRAMADIPCRIAAGEYAKPGHVIAYIACQPDSRLGFMRGPGEIRVHVQKRAIIHTCPNCEGGGCSSCLPD